MQTLLLVDDELGILESLGEILNRFGYNVIAKPDAQSALSVVRSGTRVDLVITDYRMPGMDGLEFSILLKQVLPGVPVIMLTAYGAVETYLKSLSIGIFEYVNKPVKAKDLGQIVKSALACREDSIAPSRRLTRESPSFKMRDDVAQRDDPQS
jgi:DNA-binding NtrC family response regulator